MNAFEMSPAALMQLEAAEPAINAEARLNDPATFRALDPDAVYKLAMEAYGDEAIADEWRLERMKAQMAN